MDDNTSYQNTLNARILRMKDWVHLFTTIISTNDDLYKSALIFAALGYATYQPDLIFIQRLLYIQFYSVCVRILQTRRLRISPVNPMYDDYYIFGGYNLRYIYDTGNKLGIAVRFFGMADVAATELFGDDVMEDTALQEVRDRCVFIMQHDLFPYE